jgi:hypothetical protein
MSYHPTQYGAVKRQKELERQERRQAKRARRGERYRGQVSAENPTAGLYTVDDAHDLAVEERDRSAEQFPSAWPSAWPSAPEPLAGVARTLSRGI